MKFSTSAVLLAIPMASAANLKGSVNSPFLAADDEPQPKCCVGACPVEGEVKYLSVDVKTDLCGETCMNPFWYPIFKIFEAGLERAEDGDDSPCTTLGYPKYLETVTHGGFGLYSTLDLYDHADSANHFNLNIIEPAAADCTVEYKLDGGTCGELCLSSTIAPFAEKFGGVTKGSCKDQGYTNLDHEETVSMGPFGEATVEIYTKVATKSAFNLDLDALIPTVGDDCTVEYKIDGETCGELCLSSTIAPFAEQFGGVTKGNCKDQGYTTLDHEETVSMGPFGDATVEIYTK